MQIRLDDLTGPKIIAFLEEHLRCLTQVSPPESRHALNLDGLRKPDITFWTIWNGPDLACCGAFPRQVDFPTQTTLCSEHHVSADGRQNTHSPLAA